MLAATFSVDSVASHVHGLEQTENGGLYKTPRENSFLQPIKKDKSDKGSRKSSRKEQPRLSDDLGTNRHCIGEFYKITALDGIEEQLG